MVSGTAAAPAGFKLGCLLGALCFLCGARPAAARWDGYQIIEWQPRGAAALATLKRIGVTGGMIFARMDGHGPPDRAQCAPLSANGMRWYIENIATDFYSPYHRWDPNRPSNWRFVELQQRYRADPADRSLLERQPSLSDPVWLARVRKRLVATVRDQKTDRPLFYNLADEPGIADLSAFWDFDFSPASLAGMRQWLQGEYGSLTALNAEWAAAFARWEDVVPATTREAMRRTDGNFARWADFKAWMDVAFARALRMGTDAVHRADPTALAAIEGAQMPGWGGYDYTLLAHAVDVMELYDMGENLPIAVSLNPTLITLKTTFAADHKRIHAIWRDFLRGGRGLILWDEKHEIVRDDGSLGERGRIYAPLFAELRGPLGALLTESKPRADPVGILYSPASFRTQWMLDQQPAGDAWMRRTAETELGGNAVRAPLDGYFRTLTHLGLQPRFLSPAMLASGNLGAEKVLILPHSIALSPAEARAVRAFQARGGAVIGDVAAGRFDAHSRRLPEPQIAAGLITVAPDDAAALARVLRGAGVVPYVGIDATDVEIHIFHHGDQIVLALQRDFSPEGKTETVALTFPRPVSVYDVRRHQVVGRKQRITLDLDSVAPAVLTIDGK